jgi:hypothetical protein
VWFDEATWVKFKVLFDFGTFAVTLCGYAICPEMSAGDPY